MKRRFIENLVFFLSLNLIIKPIYVFGIDLVVQNRVGTEVYGSYFALFNLVIIFQIFLDLGIENFIRKEVGHNPEISLKLFSRFLTLKLILIILFISVLSIAGLSLPQSQQEWKILLILLINQSLASFVLFLRANLGGLHLFKIESIISILDRFIIIIICGSLLYLPFTNHKFKIEWLIYSQTAAYSIAVITSLLILFNKAGIPKIKVNFLIYIPIIKKLLPYTSLALLMAFYYRIDSVFLRYFLPDGKEQAGIFAHGFRILDFMANYALIFSFILLPMFARMIRQKEDVSSLLKLSWIVLVIPSLALLSGIVFYRYKVFELLYTDHIHLSADTFMILIISYIGVCFSYTFGALLTANGNLKELNIMAIVAVVLSIGINAILIPRYKLIGAVITNASVQLFTIAFHFFIVRKKFNVEIDWKLILKVLLFIGFTISVGILISKSKLNWLFGILVISTLSILFAAIIRLINVSYFKTLFKFENLN